MILVKNCEAVMVHVLGTLEVQRWATSLGLISGGQGLSAYKDYSQIRS